MIRIVLRAASIASNSDLCGFMHEKFGPNFHVTKAEDLEKRLAEYGDSAEFVLTPREIRKICDNPTAYNVLLAIGRAAASNPEILVHIRRDS